MTPDDLTWDIDTIEEQRATIDHLTAENERLTMAMRMIAKLAAAPSEETKHG